MERLPYRSVSNSFNVCGEVSSIGCYNKSITKLRYVLFFSRPSLRLLLSFSFSVTAILLMIYPVARQSEANMYKV